MYDKRKTREDVGNNTSSCIDHIFIKMKQTNVYAAIITTTISNHYSLFCAFNKEENKKQNNQGCDNQLFRVPNFKLNNQTVSNKIKDIDWNEKIHQTKNTNEIYMTIYMTIYKTFTEIYDKSLIKTKPVKKRSMNPWINEELIKKCDYRDKLYKKWKNSENNKNYEKDYKKFRNKLNKELIYSRNNYYKHKFSENKNNIRVTWQIINEIIGKKLITSMKSL